MRSRDRAGRGSSGAARRSRSDARRRTRAAFRAALRDRSPLRLGVRRPARSHRAGMGRLIDFTRLPGLPRLDDQRAGSATCATSSRRSRRWGSGRRATSGSRPRRERARAGLLPRRAGRRSRRWRSASRAGSGATAPAVPAALAAAIVIYLGALAVRHRLHERQGARDRRPPDHPDLARRPAGRDAWSRRAAGASLLALALAVGIAPAPASWSCARRRSRRPTTPTSSRSSARWSQGQKVLFLGRDNFVVYELRGSRPFTAVRNYYDPNYVKPEPAAEGRVPEVRLRLGHPGDARAASRS